MLKILVPAQEGWDERTEQFVTIGKPTTLQLEHSLISIQKWEQKWHVPYMDQNRKKSNEEILDYIRCMTVTQNVDPAVYKNLTPENIEEISEYINDPMTATWFKQEESKGGGRNRQIMTAELIYYYMIALNIPPEYAKWHINSLLTLIEVCTRENARLNGTTPKKGRTEQARSMREINAARRAQLNTRG